MIVCCFHIMDLNPTHFPFPSHLSSNLTTLSILQDKQDIDFQKKWKVKSSGGSCSVTQWVNNPLLHILTIVSVHCIDLLVSFEVSGFLLHHQHWALTGVTLGYPIAVLCHGEPVTLSLINPTIHLLQLIIDNWWMMGWAILELKTWCG